MRTTSRLVFAAPGMLVAGWVAGCGTFAATAVPADAGAGSVDGANANANASDGAAPGDGARVDGAAPPQPIVFMMTGGNPAGDVSSELALANLDGTGVEQ